MASGGRLSFLRYASRPALASGALIAALFLLPLPAQGHVLGTSYLSLEAEGRDVSLALTFHDADLAALGDAESAASRVDVSVEAGACSRGPARSEAVPGSGVLVRTRFLCPVTVRGLTVRLGYLSLLPASHRVLGMARVGSRRLEVTASAASPVVAVDGGLGFIRFVVMGIEHILSGVDHLLFLAGLLLGARRLRSTLGVVSAFTVAHSITLALAATGVLSIPSTVVEPAIAASIVFVAAENVLRPGRSGKALVALAFGLVHGCGFASALAEAGLSGRTLVPALVGFNVGVEVGQMMVVAAALPILLKLQRRPVFDRVALPASCAALGFAGTYWLVVRVLA